MLHIRAFATTLERLNKLYTRHIQTGMKCKDRGFDAKVDPIEKVKECSRSEGGRKGPTHAENSDRGKHQISETLGLIPVKINRGSNFNPKFVRVYSILIHGTCGAPARKGTTTTRQLPSAPDFEVTDASGDNGVTR